MLNLKKTAVAVLAFSSSAVFAGTMGPVCTPGNVTVPCERSAWDFAGQALYLDPAFGGNNFVGSVTDGAGNLSYVNDNKWSWGFKLEGSYHFNTGNDVDLNWYHWNRTNNRVFGAGLTDFAGFAYAGGLAVQTKPQWDAVNLEFGQHVDFSQFSSARFHAGVQYARVKGALNVAGVAASTATLPTVAVGDTVGATANATYNGFGPRGGVDLGYSFGNGLAVYGNTAAALLAGSNKFNVTAANLTTGLAASAGGSTTTVVPELEGKLGATYTYAMAQGDLSLDVGWLWINYFNVQELGNVAGLGVTEANFSVQGPFIGLKWVGNIA